MYIREFQSFFDQSQDIIGLVDTELKYVAVNLTLCSYWGVQREDVVGAQVQDIVGPIAFAGTIQENMLRCLEGEDIAYEAWIRFPRMGQRHVDVKYTPRRDEYGNVTGIFLIARDKTEAKLLMEKVETERDGFDEILSSLNVGLVLYNPDYSVEWTNTQFTKMFPVGDTQGSKCHQLFRGKDAPCNDCPVVETFRTGESRSREINIEEGTVWYNLSAEPIFDDEGRVAQVLGHLIDITERKVAQKALLESEQRFREIFENVDMIAVQGYDEGRRVIYWNPASERLYGYSQDEAMGELLEDLIIPEPLHEMVKAGHKAWVEESVAIPAAEIELVHKDGSPVPVYSSHVMQVTASGEKYMYCVDVDLAEIKRIHNQLVQAKEEAEAANQAKSEFLANMSHEIRTPLNGIQGMLSLLQTTSLDETQQEYAHAGFESAVRLSRLLSDILDISRVEAGRMAVESEPFNLPNLVAHIRAFFRLSFREAGVTLHCHVDENVPQQVVGDSARLQQVLTNLVGNGLKYTDTGDVHLDVSRLSMSKDNEHRILFSVKDTGIGISKGMLDSLFEPFVQGSRGYSRRYQGAGLGLSICKRLVDLMGGNMSVESKVGEGSTFHLVIPFKREWDVSMRSVPFIEDNEMEAHRLNILLAEDDRVNSMVGMRLLEKAGCTVTLATNGLQAVDLLRKQAYDAVFMDVQMPEMDGLEATESIRNGQAGADRADIPIIAMTAYTMAGDRERFLAHGMDGYIPKPVEMHDLLRMLKLAGTKKNGKKRLVVNG